MLTPVFVINQNDSCLTIIIKAPLANISETEIHSEDSQFIFYSSPYHLRLNLPGKVVETEENVLYDSAKGEFTVKLNKANPGEVFEGLDLITKLLSSAKHAGIAKPVIEVLSETTNHGSDIELASDDSDLDWTIEQTPADPCESLRLDIASYDGHELTSKAGYGFDGCSHGVFDKLIGTELNDVIDLKNADGMTSSERRRRRLSTEKCNFSEDYYLADLYQNECILRIIDYQPVYESDSGFSASEREKMSNLPKRCYLLSKIQKRRICFGLVDILFAYSYDLRTTEGEHNIESGWTICKLSAVLSWLEVFGSLKEVLVCSYRRCLTYPLYRNFDLVKAVRGDVEAILKLGRNQVIKALLEIHGILATTEGKYILNELYLTDYCVWMQLCSEKRLRKLYEGLLETEVSKDDLGLELNELEYAAEVVRLEAESGGNDSVEFAIPNAESESQSEAGSEDKDLAEDLFGLTLDDCVRVPDSGDGTRNQNKELISEVSDDQS